MPSPDFKSGAFDRSATSPVRHFLPLPCQIRFLRLYFFIFLYVSLCMPGVRREYAACQGVREEYAVLEVRTLEQGGANMAQKLTKSLIDRTAVDDTKDTLIFDSQVPGFGVRITPRGVRSFIVQKKKHGRVKRKTLGRYGHLTVDQARRMAQEWLHSSIASNSHSPPKEDMTLGDAIAEYKTMKRLTPKSQKQIDEYMREFGDWMNHQIRSIDESDVEKRFRKIESRSPAQASIAFRWLRAIINYNLKRHNIKSIENPVNIITRSELWPKPKSKTGYLSKGEPAKLYTLAIDECSPSSLACILMMLTGLRKTTALTLHKRQYDHEQSRLIDINTKNRTGVIIPLSEHASHACRLAVDHLLPNDYLFPSRGGHIKDVRSFLARSGVVTQKGQTPTPHDLRRTFINAAIRAGLSFDQARLLALHEVQDEVMLKHYLDTGDLTPMREVTESISRHLLQNMD